ncbi:hypothetical protein M9458_031497, partial [Cirrhinus mrigala]
AAVTAFAQPEPRTPISGDHRSSPTTAWPRIPASPKSASKVGQSAAKVSKCHSYYPPMQGRVPSTPAEPPTALDGHSKRLRAKAREQALSPSKHTQQQPSPVSPPAPDREQNAGGTNIIIITNTIIITTTTTTIRHDFKNTLPNS